MNYLTTNFGEDQNLNFTAPFPLLDLPLEILYKIIIFLDFPDLINLSKTCLYLERVANDRFIYSSRFYQTKNRIGISIQNRPSINELYSHHIMPVKSTAMFNPNQLYLVSMLTKSIVKDNLKKNLQKRPSFNELKEKNILKSNTNELIQSKIKEFKKQNLSNVLSVYVNSYKFQQKQSTTEEEYKSLLQKFYSSLRSINPTSQTSKTTISRSTDSSSNSNSNPNGTTATKFLNHIEQKNQQSKNRSVSQDSKIYSKKQYFENLVNSSQKSPIIERPKEERKPSRTLLNAKVDHTKINYEKVF
ncbi:Mitochondrial F-box protein MFB1 [Wickerhamomyces ciferrii]|uniref:Mitochondrial F-box protein MFB1 n=1 Tax=Wickerhamomyces ciferrii (strain ATCC 14091 / BCRC 22168 / CBS 111 / JCM 3599 / NBRC 0793 / NRRL Y-1031 F-60-10) TaxID=1206466 RepID=K0KKY5_WICCF|nr:Mitochondrial F-box protein MFB1 [Wickerhamomyces ciferrii]CCH42807.1 Mitochondrial F-box protein MFB1 [Wickerhamomyces ciferrii]